MKMKAFRGENGRWGVGGNGLLYEAGFCRRTAQRIAELENSPQPPLDWEHARKILKRTGFDVAYEENP